MSDWISTKYAMSLLGVGSTTIKRWADDGRLPYYKTAGGHRRFRRSAVEVLATGESGLSGHTDGLVKDWCRSVADSNLAQTTMMIRQLVEKSQDWFAAADFLGDVVREIGDAWASADCTIIEEHISTTKISQGLSAVAADFDFDDDAPVAVVATIEGDRHAIGSMLAQLCLMARGVNAQLLGTNVVAEQLTEHIRTTKVDVVALSASAWQSDSASLRRFAITVGRVAEQLNTQVLLGGTGAWPDTLEYGHRCDSFADLRNLMDRKRLLN